MKKNYSLLIVLSFVVSFVNAQEYVNPDITYSYRIQQKEGQVFTILPENDYPTIINHWGNGDNPQEDQFFKFIVVDGKEDTYNIQSVSTNKYVAVMDRTDGDNNNTWDGELVDDPALETAQFKFEEADPSHVYIMNVSNSKYMAPDELDPGKQVYFDKSKSEKAYWQLHQYENITSNLHSVTENNGIYVKDGYITIKDVESFKVYSVTGAEVNPKVRLNSGIYIVLFNGGQYKVLVK